MTLRTSLHLGHDGRAEGDLGRTGRWRTSSAGMRGSSICARRIASPSSPAWRTTRCTARRLRAADQLAAPCHPRRGGDGHAGLAGGVDARAGVTVAHLTPAMASSWPRRGATRRSPRCGSPASGATCCARATWRAWRHRPGREAVNFYGATETPQALLSYHVDPAELGREARGAAGPRRARGAAAGAAPSRRPGGRGRAGRGRGCAARTSPGYLGDAELTAARFVANPLDGRPGRPCLPHRRPGPLPPRRPVEPAGRADQQVQVRGFRVELGEIEAALAAHAAVREAVVAAARRRRRREVGSSPGSSPGEPRTARTLPRCASTCARALPDFMVPAAFVWMDALPLTPTARSTAAPFPTRAPSPPAAPRASADAGGGGGGGRLEGGAGGGGDRRGR